jgi:hypothetical protein
MNTRTRLLTICTLLSAALCVSAEELAHEQAQATPMKLRGIRLLSPALPETANTAAIPQAVAAPAAARDCDVKLRGVTLTAAAPMAAASPRDAAAVAGSTDCPNQARVNAQTPRAKAAKDCDRTASAPNSAQVAALEPLTIRGVKVRGIRLLADTTGATDKLAKADAGKAPSLDCDKPAEDDEKASAARNFMSYAEPFPFSLAVRLN